MIYANPWHKPGHPEYGPERYETEATPVHYRGFLIVQRIRGVVWDVVKDGVCVSQRAGFKGAKAYIDQQLGGAA